MASLGRVLNNHHLKRKDLDFKCPRKIRDRIAREIIDEWYLLGRKIGVSLRKLKSIRLGVSFTPEEKAVAVLDAWADEYGRRATCLMLARALYSRKKISVIEILCEKVRRRKNDKSTSGPRAALSHQPLDSQLQQQGDTVLRSINTASTVD